MRDHDFWLCRNSLAPVPVLQVSNESARCALDVEEIHRIRADAREFRPLTFARVAALCSRNDFSDGPPAQPTRAKRERLVETIV